VSLFVLDASYTLAWCFRDRATPNTNATLKRLEAAADSAIVPPIWHIEVANALGKGVVRRKLSSERAQDIWAELALLPIRQSTCSLEVPKLLELAVQHNLGVYDVCHLQAARLKEIPLASNDHDLLEAAESYGVPVMRPQQANLHKGTGPVASRISEAGKADTLSLVYPRFGLVSYAVYLP